ncbi:hypothetical protein, variant [Aphanomyces invadans]|uniref:Cyclin-like domain-containing protein n=1 Tax=Aphanomyces invadans TaxID=157072 RepID=A0A024TFS0_9STRA|nr:hypothetical protein, variant [Aphanomyces invadans]ETV92411.1 hypothetical protein, variant [Aphanomyces invadans]|eukprot:XP_008878962.1 hypothetical protein, variant [Aphanomyces invadans]
MAMPLMEHSLPPTSTSVVPTQHVSSSFIADCSARLHLGHVATTTAMVLAHRYYGTHKTPHSFPQHQVIGAACIFLATKITEKPRKLRDVMNVVHCASLNVNSPMPTGPEYTAFKERLLDAEQNVLRAIRFDMDVALPYQHLLNYTKILGYACMTAGAVHHGSLHDSQVVAARRSDRAHSCKRSLLQSSCSRVHPACHRCSVHIPRHGPLAGSTSFPSS